MAQEAIDGHRVVKAFGGQAYEAAHFGFINEKTRSLQMKMIATEAASVPLVQLISALAIAVIVYLSTMQGLREDISVGTFMSFVVAMGLLLPPIKRLTGVNSHLQRGIIAAESLFELLDCETEHDQRHPHPGPGPGPHRVPRGHPSSTPRTRPRRSATST